MKYLGQLTPSKAQYKSSSVTSSLLYADGSDEEETPDNATTDEEDDHTDKERKTGEGPAAAHAASVDDTPDGRAPRP